MRTDEEYPDDVLSAAMWFQEGRLNTHASALSSAVVEREKLGGVRALEGR